jgi:anti-sigma B factor antagonist
MLLSRTIMSAFPSAVGISASQTPSQSRSITDLEIQVASNENVSILCCHGRLIYGLETAELVRATRHALETTKEIVPQMADMTQIDSGGVGALGTAFIAAHNREAEIKLAALHPRVAEILRITGLDLLFDIRESESEALGAFLTKQRFDAMDLTGTPKGPDRRIGLPLRFPGTLRVNECNGDFSPTITSQMWGCIVLV